jgi:hypothetical protein
VSISEILTSLQEPGGEYPTMPNHNLGPSPVGRGTSPEYMCSLLTYGSISQSVACRKTVSELPGMLMKCLFLVSCQNY